MAANHVDFVTSPWVRDKALPMQQSINRTNCEKTNLDTEVGAMPLISALSRQPLQAFLLVVVAVALGGCAITIQRPANNETIILPTPTKVVVAGNASYTGLKVTADTVDFSSQMFPTGPSSHEGNISLGAGSHTIRASAEVFCWYCTGGKTQSTDTKAFVVAHGAAVCARSGGAPVVTIDASTITAAQQPGRRLIAYLVDQNQPAGQQDALLVIVDDAPAPGLPRTQMRVELDIDPFNGVTWGKAIEAWAFCRRGSRVNVVEASMVGGINVGTACAELTAANDYRSGCTNTQTMLLDQSTTSELWLRKPGLFGIWHDVGALDSSIWQALGGRSVRFIWVSD